MKKTPKSTRTTMADGRRSNECDSDDDKSRLITIDSNFSDNDEDLQLTVQRRQAIKMIPSIRKSTNNEKNVMRRSQTVHTTNRISSNESERTDSGIGHDTELYRQLHNYTDLSHRYSKVLKDHDNECYTSMNNDSHPTEHMNEDLRLEKTGWLNMKYWLTVQYPENIHLLSKYQWKRFWIWLKDSNLLLYSNYSDIQPKFTINTIDCLCYPLPEYRSRQNVFSLTTSTGDTYCFQSSNQSEVDHWIYCIHSNCLLNINIDLLKSTLEQLENDIIYENKMLKLARLQLKISSNEQTRSFISNQVELWERNLELIRINLFRKKCYLFALNKNLNLPNSKDLLTQISPTTKILLLNLDAFTPCGIYACVISRWPLDHSKSKSKQEIELSKSKESPETILQTILFDSNPQRKIIISINKTTTVGELLKRITDKLGLSDDDYFLYCYSTSTNDFLPNQNDIIHTLIYSSIEIRRKVTYQILLNHQPNLSGIIVNRQNPLRVFVTNVKKESEGERLGVIKGDEIIMINNTVLKELDSTSLNRYLNQTPITLTFRSSRLSRRTDTSQVMDPRKLTTSVIKNKKVDERLSSMLIKPIDELNQLSQPITDVSDAKNEHLLCNISRSNSQHIQKAILELIDTERSYVHDLQYLLKQYIEPLRNNSTILPLDTIEALYDIVKSIQQLQIRFLANLQSTLFTENILIFIAETFIQSSKDFKLYSTYCIIHLRINRLLNLHQNNEHLKEFLSTCNSHHQHSFSFQSYLIKPVQRILKYPLFLQQILRCCNADENHEILLKEKSKLKKTIKVMTKINKYINSMQQLYEDFGQSFENFMETSKEQTFKFNLLDLHAYGELNWINIYRFLSKKNSHSLKTFCFVFRNGCLLLGISLNCPTNKNTSDLFIRFLPIHDLQVELINDNDKNLSHTWQIIQTDPKTQLKTYFRFANKDASIFVQTINNCISTIKSHHNEYVLIPEPSNLLNLSASQKRLSSSHSFQDFLPRSSLSGGNSEKNRSMTSRQSLSPVWKRRTLSLRKRPLSMTNNKNCN